MFAVTLMASEPALAQDARLDVSGSCPGDVVLDASGLTPGGVAFLVAADELGAAPVPAGPCAGTSMGLDTVAAFKRVTADGAGMVRLEPMLSEASCERQAIVLDSSTCRVSDPVSLIGAPNLVANAGFEAGESPWSIWGGAMRTAADAHTGDWAVEATSNNGAEQLVVGLEPNATYRLSGWGKTNGPEPLLIGVKNYGGGQRSAAFTTAEYSEGSISFTTGFSSTEAVIFAYKAAGDASAHADDLVLQLETREAHVPIWSDEFNAAGALDDDKWTYESGFVRNEELQWYQPENAFQEDGALVIEARVDGRPNPAYDPDSELWQQRREFIDYTSSSVTTQDRFTWQYGTLVVRAKVSNLTGTWPAIWTLGTTCTWPSRGEVDVMENYGGDILANFAWGTDTPFVAEWDASHWPVADFGAGWVDDFHIWELDWDASRMVIRLDGDVLNEVSLDDTINGSADCAGDNPFRQPHYLLLNLALGSAGGSVDDLEFPTRYLIDYVRVYE